MVSATENTLVSIILPVHNAEKYLMKTLKSIRNQTYQYYEVIMINDGSTDYSDEICQEIEALDIRFKYYSQKNKGVSATRNFGMNVAIGEKITFVDADDYIQSNHLESMMNKNADLVISGVNKISSDGIIFEKTNHKDVAISRIEALKDILIINDVRAYCWNKLFSREIISKHNIRFDENISISEDTLFCFNYICYCNSICFTQENTYFYQINGESVTGKRNNNILWDNKYLSVLDAIKQIIDLSRGIDLDLNYSAKARYFFENMSLLKLQKRHKKSIDFQLLFGLREYYFSFLRSNIYSYKRKLVMSLYYFKNYLHYIIKYQFFSKR